MTDSIGNATSGEEPTVCARCAAVVHPGRGDYYLVRIEAVRDPAPLVISDDDLHIDVAREIEILIRSLRQTTEQEALDQVFRQKVIYLCVRCLESWIADPVKL